MADLAEVPQRHVLSNATIRSIKLLNPVLPLISDVAALNYAHARLENKRKEKDFWVGIVTPCYEIEQAGNGAGLRTLNHEPDNLFNKILKTLESMINSSLLANDEEFSSSEYPRLETLRKIESERDMDDEKRALRDRDLLKQPYTTEDCKSLTSHLSQLRELLNIEAEKPILETTSVTITRRRVLSPLLSNMFSTMSKLLECTTVQPQHKHQAALPLLTHKGLSSDDESIVFNILLSRSHKLHQWRKASITVAEEPTRPTEVCVVIPTKPKKKPDASKAAKTEISSLCVVINDNEASHLNLGIDGDSLFRASVEQTHLGLESGEMVSLADGILTSEQTTLNFDARICMALVLSYSFIDFCGESWFSRGWSRDCIYLMQKREKLTLRPYLQTQIKPIMHPAQDRVRDSAETRLLHHGLLLMEIFFQEPLVLGVSSKENLATLRKVAKAHFDQRSFGKRWDHHYGYHQAVQTCIMGDIQSFPSRRSVEDEEKFAQEFCKKIIAPLETEFQAFCGMIDPDEMISTLEIPGVKSRGLRPKPRSLIPVRATQNRVTKPAQHQEPDTLVSKLFDAEDTVEQREIQDAQSWFRRFEQLARHRLPPRPGLKDQRIKVAVLDTGIDRTNDWISGRVGRLTYWPNAGDCQDETGHGTHVAYLLLHFAPHVDLHVHKVSKSDSLEDADIHKIAKAITISSTGENKVDIINLSFGFPQYGGKLQPIKDAIHNAGRNNVLIFAAAGNEGLNQKVPWPARLATDVLRIGASDAFGQPSRLSSESDSTSRISTLGEAVPSCPANSTEPQIHRNGTSFAAPIAAAIAAVILQFMDNPRIFPLPPDYSEVVPRLRTRDGMEMVLQGLCVRGSTGPRSEVAYITPWHFFQRDAHTNFYMVLDILRNID